MKNHKTQFENELRLAVWDDAAEEAKRTLQTSESSETAVKHRRRKKLARNIGIVAALILTFSTLISSGVVASNQILTTTSLDIQTDMSLVVHGYSDHNGNPILPPSKFNQGIRPEYLPEGFVLDFETYGSDVLVQWVNDNDPDKFVFFQASRPGSVSSVGITRGENFTLNDCNVNGAQGILAKNENFTFILWAVDSAELCLSGNLPDGELLKIAESVK